MIKSGILTLIGITVGSVSSFFRVPLFKRVGGLRVVRFAGVVFVIGAFPLVLLTSVISAKFIPALVLWRKRLPQKKHLHKFACYGR